ncbi:MULTISPECIES: MlaE family ABC transporter permease [Pseudonocardia]|uniref:ABC transporter permease n=2 Tax=Pseudonocardia TaxID=1847 RepID=A0ABQ0RY92_9PSEU|nr:MULTISPECIES: ABC transporter permease [Pseudonocardia]OSY40956.1 putative phospholipid ABC transporter permease protein MlaE [Pseudonocardia autotrophica]TDN73914.1 phospholipid/cholesterol/gamma-HCH transport system permease protein [Pseudonocardia autotrophica]BBG04667.1 ABC transporter permease [Pseudonocardia autotrophica]GEC25631.1 ABC transporter permease [Pseudonocardia saturnea]
MATTQLGARVRRAAQAPLNQLEELGDQLSLYIRSILWIPKTLTRYRKEVARLLAEVSFGSGALIVILGTVGVMASLSLFVGSLVGLQGFRALDALGVEAMTGFITAYFNTRSIAPLVAAAALTATLGAGFTAQLGAMRISEEIDALEVMAVPSVPYLVTTRVIAGIIAIVPIYTLGLLASYAAARLNVTLINGLPGGTYDHYFNLFLPVSDVLLSYLKVIIFATVIILIHCHYGYSAKGGPAGVGVAVGRAVRLSIVSTAIMDFFLTLVMFGTSTSVRVAG